MSLIWKVALFGMAFGVALWLLIPALREPMLAYVFSVVWFGAVVWAAFAQIAHTDSGGQGKPPAQPKPRPKAEPKAKPQARPAPNRASNPAPTYAAARGGDPSRQPLGRIEPKKMAMPLRQAAE